MNFFHDDVPLLSEILFLRELQKKSLFYTLLRKGFSFDAIDSHNFFIL